MFGGGSSSDKPALGPAGDVAFLSSGGDDRPVDADAATFWAAERAWQASELAKPLAVQVTDPQTTSSTFSSFTTYLVTCALAAEGVRRRYSDFEWVRDLLVARYHGIAVPLMPEKRMVGNQGKAFIEERMGGLENFMQLILSNPYLRNDATMRMFLTQKGAPEFEQAKNAAAQGVGSDPATNTGLAHWFGVLRHITLPADADKACAELNAYLDESEARVNAALGGVVRFHDAARGLTEALKGVKDSLGEWASHATAASTGLSEQLLPVRGSSGALAARLKTAAAATGHAHDLSVFAPNEIQIFLMDGLVTEIHRIRSLKALIAVRAAAEGAYSRAWVAQDKLEFQAKQFRDKGRQDRADPLMPKIAEAVGIMKRMKERLDDVTKGLLVVEADKVSRVRVQRVLLMFGQFAALSIASGVRTQEIWNGFLAANSLTQASMVADAQATLTGSMTMHALDATGSATPFFLPGAVCGDASLQELIAASGSGAGAVAVPVPAPAAGGAAEADSKFIGAFAAGGGGALPATSNESAFVTTDL